MADNNKKQFIKYENTVYILEDSRIPDPTSDDNGKVLGVVNGEYALKQEEGGGGGAVTSVNNVQPDANGNVTLQIPTVPQMATQTNMSDWSSGKTVDAAALKTDFQVALQALDDKANASSVYTKTEIDNKGYLTQHQSLANYQTKAITDTGNYYTTDTVEGALQEIGAELASAGSASVPRIAKTAQDTTATIDPNKLYVFPEMASLTITLATITDNTIVNEYHFVFDSGSAATVLTLPATVLQPDGFTVEANMHYEVSILEGAMTAQGWAVSSS